MFAGNFGVYNPIVTRIVAFLLMASIFFLNIRIPAFFHTLKHLRGQYGRDVVSGLLLMIISAVLLFLFSIKEVWLVQLPLYLIGLNILLQGTGNKRNDPFILVFISFFYAFFIVLLQNIPVLFSLFQQFSILVSKSVGAATKPMVLGASASGLWMLFSFLLFLITLFIFSENRKDKWKGFWITFFALCIGWIFYLVIQGYFPFYFIVDKMNFSYVLFIINMVILFPFLLKTKMVTFHAPSLNIFKGKKQREKWGAIAICFLVFLSGVFLTVFIVMGTSPEKNNIAIYLRGTTVGAYDLPEYGKYGEESSGFFGALPQYLRSFGYTVEMINETITSTHLERNKVLVFINLGETFTNETLTLIWDFVKNGGGLLVLGDHTDIGGIMHPLNTLLEPVGIRYRFDSAVPIKGQWESCVSFLHHPITEGVETAKDFGVSIGASLDVDITKSAFPIIIGKGGFSDTGSYLTPGSFLGDYNLNPGEQLGDVTLVAGAYYGQGRILVFGDTSEFQNVALSKSSHFIMNIFTWLSSTSNAFFFYVQIGTSLILFCVAVALFRMLRGEFFYLVPIFFCSAIIFSSAVNPVIMREQVPTGPLCYIDISHGERVDKGFYNDESISGLTLNLLRNEYKEEQRYLPLQLKVFSKEKIQECKILMIIAPTEPFTGDEITSIRDFVSQGGLLILSVGYPDIAGSSGLLETFGFDILPTPLGPIPFVEYNITPPRNEPRFVDSWPISFHNTNTNETTILYKVNFSGTLYSLIIFKRYDQGGVLLISDSQFLLDKNLESLNDYWPGNINLLRNILAEIKTQGVPQ